MTNSTMNIWNAVATPDKKYLKKVTLGSRSFTAIDPQYQIMKATEIWGPVGQGWSYTADMHYIPTQDGQILAVAEVTVWTETPGNVFGPIPGVRTFYGKASKKAVDYTTNEDAPKMAVTDGLTKALSHLGICADVFLGKMDDNKYAADAKADPAAKMEDW